MRIYHKFKAKRSEIDSISFASQKEARYYAELCLRQKAGEIVFFLRQVPLHLPGGIRYIVDFLEFCADGEVRFVDVKGYRTREYIAKKKMIEAMYPIEIIEK